MTTAIVGALGAVLVSWLALRLLRPELELRYRGALIAGASVLVGVLLAVVTLGASRREPKTPETLPKPPAVDPKEVLEDVEERFETDDTFEELENNADDLVKPVDLSGDLALELADFRKGSSELLGDGNDPK